MQNPRYAEIIEGSQSYALQVIKIVFPFNFEDIDKVKTLIDRKFISSEKYWTCKVDLGNATKLKTWGFTLSQSLEDMLRTRDTAIGGENVITKDTVKSIEVPGLKQELFPFQKIGVSFIEEKNGRALIADEMGLGKTVQALAWLQLHPELRPAIIVVPASLKLNWLKEAKIWMSSPKAVVLSGTKTYAVRGEIIIINYDIINPWLAYLSKLGCKVLILDEIQCFPAGTKIETPNGLKNIEQLKKGDLVFNAIGEGIIQNISKRNTKELIRLYLSNNTHIDVTSEHPFFTEKGWLPAKELKNEKLFFRSDIFNILAYNFKLKNYATNEKMRMVWRNVSSIYKNKKVLWCFLRWKILWIFKPFKKSERNQKLCFMRKRISSNREQTFLREILLSEMEDATTRNKESRIYFGNSNKIRFGKQRKLQTQSRKSKTIFPKDDKKQSYEKSRNCQKNKSKLGSLWTSINKTEIERWEWKTFTKSTENFMGCIRTRLENGISYFNKTAKRFWLSNLLQSRYSSSRIQNMDRNRWMVPWFIGKKRKGRKERTVFNNVRVERIEILKSTSNEQFEGCSVYNLQVSGHPSYFAEGILVHNCIKNSGALRTKAVKKLAKGIRHVIGLSGTPIVNRPIEAYNALTIINSAAIPNFKQFTHRFCAAKYNGFGWDYSGASNTAELHLLLVRAFMLRRKKSEVLKDLPDKIKAFIPMELTNQEEYDNAELNFISYLQNTKGLEAAAKASGAEALVKIEGLKQLALQGKIKACIDWIEEFLESDQKLVIFAVHKSAIDMLMQKFGRIAVKVDGSVSMTDRNKAVEAFQNNEAIRLFVGNIIAAGVGITLTAASNVAFIELPWSPSSVLQASDRVHRIGQKDSVTIHFLLAANTIEEKIANLLDKKQIILDAVLDGEKTDEKSLLSELMNEYL